MLLGVLVVSVYFTASIVLTLSRNPQSIWSCQIRKKALKTTKTVNMLEGQKQTKKLKLPKRQTSENGGNCQNDPWRNRLALTILDIDSFSHFDSYLDVLDVLDVLQIGSFLQLLRFWQFWALLHFSAAFTRAKTDKNTQTAKTSNFSNGGNCQNNPWRSSLIKSWQF